MDVSNRGKYDFLSLGYSIPSRAGAPVERAEAAGKISPIDQRDALVSLCEETANVEVVMQF